MSAFRSRHVSQPMPRGRRRRPFVEPLEARRLLSTFIVSDTSDSATDTGSLRYALSKAQNGDTIHFDIPTTDPGYNSTAGSWTIAPTSALPAVSHGVDIDATTQPGFSTGPLIVLDGSKAGAGINGLILTAAGCTIRGLVVDGFGGSGIVLEAGASSSVVEGDYVGTDVTGAVAVGNGAWGVAVVGASDCTLGGTSTGAGNLISGNNQGGLYIIDTSAVGDIVEGNRIGTDASGAKPLGNAYSGVYVGDFGNPGNAASQATIGGTAAGAGNLISGNGNSGVWISGAGTTGVAIQGNKIGTDGNGAAAIPNAYDGVDINRGASDDTVGGTAVRAGNLISGNTIDGIQISDVGTLNNLIQGNIIGMNSSGSTAIANGNHGVRIIDGAAGVTIGGTTAGAANVISGNADDGVMIYDDPSIASPTTDIVVQGNAIGATADGESVLANGWNGVQVYDWVTAVTIGGTTTGALNVVSGNTDDGINIGAAGAGNLPPSGILIQGNDLGTDKSGLKALPNGWNGVNAFAGASGITVGGTAAGSGNLISGNLIDGVRFSGVGTSNELVEGNWIGTDSTGAAAIANGNHGVRIIDGASAITIGGTAAAARNIISGNTDDGIMIYNDPSIASPTTGILIQGNLLGVTADGESILSNGWNGVQLYDWVTAVTIGGTTAAAHNVLSGNLDDGVNIGGAGGTDNPPSDALIEGNFIGTDKNGIRALHNGGNGVEIYGAASGITIGGTTASAGNVASGNSGTGLGVNDSTANLIAGNIVGLAADGVTPLGNVIQGIGIGTGSTDNTIGGTTSAAANIIAANGIGSSTSWSYANFDIQDAGTSDNLAEGNFVGTDSRNDAGLNPSYSLGLFVGYGATDNTIGGTTARAGNILSGNAGDGLDFFQSGTSGNLAIGNLIGLASDGASKLGNAGAGVDILVGATGNTIGGTAAGSANVISGNAGDGIYIGSDDTVVLSNLIGTDRTGVFAVANGGLGIDVESAGNTVGGVTNTAANANPFAPMDPIVFGGQGTSTSPEVLAAMGQDLGSGPAGFDQNFVDNAITLTGNTYVRLVNNLQGGSGTQPGAVYVNALTVPAGTTLDLNGLHLYARAAQIGGSVVNGIVTEVPDAGPITWGTWSPGRIAQSQQVDDWTFFGRAGQAVTLVLNPGVNNSPAPLAPQLNDGEITVLDTGGHVLATASSSSFGASVTISGLVLPADGTYQVLVQAGPGFSEATGHYLVALYDATVHTAAAALNQSLFGSIDSPYASDLWTFTAQANQQVRFNLLGDTDPALAFSLSGPNNYVGFSGITTSSGLVTLPSSGTYTLTVDPRATQDGATYSFQIDATSLTDLALGIPYQGTLAGSGQAELFRVALPVNEALMVNFQDSSSADEDQVYVKYGAPPTLSDYQYSGSNLAAASQQVLVPSAAPGDWYVLVIGNLVPSPSTYTITATAASLFLFGATPGHSSTDVDTTMTLTGAGFNAGTTVSLVAAGGKNYPLTGLAVDTPTQMTAVIKANSVPAGTYTVEAAQAGGGSAELPDVFTMVQGGQAVLTTSVIVPNPIGYHIASTIYVQYSNTGDAPMPAPLLELTAYQNGVAGALMTLDASKQVSGFWTNATPEGYSQSVQILASGATPGILQPGESETIPVYYAGWLTGQWDFSRPPINFVLGALQVGDTTPIDWTSLEQSTQPSDISPGAWGAIFANIEAETGSTFGDYVQRLDAEASYLGTLGENVTDISQLFGFEVQQANGLGPITQLASATDASAPALGPSLSFSRSFSPSLSGRDQMGPFGLGWYDSWQATLAVQSDGTVVVTEPGGAQRVFQPDSRNPDNYFGQAGDHGVLTPIGNGAFTLTEQDGTVTAYNPDGTLDYVVDTNGNRITAGYTNGLLTSLNDSDGQSILIAYNAAGLIDSVTDPFGQTTTYAYDTTDTHLLSVTTFDGEVTSYTYNTSTNPETQNALTAIAYADGTHAYYTYDAEGRIASTSADDGAEMTTFAYGPGGEVDSTDADGNTTKVYFDDRGLIAKSEDPLGRTTVYSYDNNDNLVQVTDAAGQVTTNNYDSEGNLVSTTNPLGQTTSYTYTTTDDDVASITDANGDTTQYAYDGQGNLTSTTYADGTIASLAYDPVGNVISSTDQDGQAIAYTYNAAGQVLTKTYADGSVDTFAYDAHDNLVSTTDATGTTLLTYDAADRLTQITYPSGLYLKFTYDSAGRRTQMVDQGGFTVNYAYDAVGGLLELTDGSGDLIVKYTYDPAGNLIRADMGNGTYTTYSYDAASELIDLVNHAPDSSINSSFAYTYNDMGLQATETTLDGTWTYSYDATGQLTLAVFASANPAVANQDLAYTYDAAGNRTSTVINGVTTTYTTNNRNEYTAVGGTTYTYDADGNMTSATDAAGTTTYTYDANNRLVGESGPGGTWSYQYDALGYRVASTANGVTTESLLDPAGLGNVVGTYTGSGQLIANYVYGLGLTSQVTAGGSTYDYEFDATGSTVGLTGNSGAGMKTYSYLPFGQLLTGTGSIPNPFQFDGQQGVSTDGNGLTFMRNREYDAVTGQFVSDDPLGLAGGDPNIRRFAANDPVDSSDPSGLCDTCNDVRFEVGLAFHLPASFMIQGGGAFTMSVDVEETMATDGEFTGFEAKWQPEGQAGGYADIGASAAFTWGKAAVVYTAPEKLAGVTAGFNSQGLVSVGISGGPAAAVPGER